MQESSNSAELTDNVQELTGYGVKLAALIDSKPIVKTSRRKLIAGSALIWISFAWVGALVACNLTYQTLAWCVAFLGLAGICMSWLYGKSIRPALSSFKLGELKPASLAEALTAVLILFSGVLCGWLAWHHFKLEPTFVERRQIVDIEFVSDKDATNNGDILPGTVPKPSQKPQEGTADHSVQGTKLVQPKTKVVARAIKVATLPPARKPIAKSASKSLDHIEKIEKTAVPIIVAQPAAFVQSAAPVAVARKAIEIDQAVSDKPVEAQHWQGFAPGGFKSGKTTQISASAWETKTIAYAPPRTQPSPAASAKSARSATLEEVAPPELVELTDSQGDAKGNDVWQPGGRSTGGKGAQNQLVPYLKEIHRRIKHSWTPPGGETRTAEILFRIRSSGDLSSMKIIKSSGDSDLDEAAMNAIASCFPYKPIPADYQHKFIDLQYTFNYHVDKLTEASSTRTF